MSIKETWSQHITSNDLNEDYLIIMHQVCSQLQYILHDDTDDIENTNIVITYKIERKKINKGVHPKEYRLVAFRDMLKLNQKNLIKLVQYV